jgi:demethylmenaquinone methyltransferase/2-methoxy-6-polyprenyl-1,4-benzoquinol methylase
MVYATYTARMSVTENRSPASWSTEDLAESPHEHAEKAARVKTMFSSIARRYDLNNTLHSFGRDRAWRHKALAMTKVDASSEVLDVACGTGALAEAFRAAGVRRVVGLDYTPEMLSVARQRAKAGAFPAVEYIEGDAMKLPFDDASFDVLSIAFGIRNVGDPDRALGEFARVVRPGGRLVVLEFAQPRNRLVRFGNAVYSQKIMPRTAALIARDRSGAYDYLPRSIETFLDPAELAARIESHGFAQTRAVPMTFGVCVATCSVRMG